MGLSGALCLQRELSVGVRHRGRRPCWRAAAEEILLPSPAVAPSPPHYAALLHTWERLLRERLKWTFSPAPRSPPPSLFIPHSFHQSVWVPSAQRRSSGAPSPPLYLSNCTVLIEYCLFLFLLSLRAAASHRLFRRQEAFLK